MRILIIGGAGFLGSNIAIEALKKGHSVRILTRPTRSLERLVTALDRVEVFHGDFLDDHVVGEALAGVDAVVHSLSTTFPKTVVASAVYDVSTNLVPTMRLVDLCIRHGVRNLTYLSSGGTVYGEARYLPIDEEHPRSPLSLYGLSKLTIENYLQFIAREQKLSAKILRVSNPYGPTQNAFGVQGIVGVALGRMRRGMPVTIFGDGQNIRDYIDVRDVADAVVRAIEYPESTVINIGTGVGTSIVDLVNLIAREAGVECRLEWAADRTIDVRRNILANTRAREQLGWTPSIALDEGIREAVTPAVSKETAAQHD